MMKFRLSLAGVCWLLASSAFAQTPPKTSPQKASQPLVLAKGGVSSYRIIVGVSASPSEKYAARELQRFLREISGATLPIADDSGPVQRREILIGDNRHLRALGISLDFARLGDEGFVLRSGDKNSGQRVVIAGGRLRGSLYGVYTLLEEYFGCRWLTPDCSVIPKRDVLSLPPFRRTVIPRFAYRDVWFRDAFDGDWCARNRLTAYASRLTPEQGGKFPLATPNVHTLYFLLPPETYFKEHPEYFALVDGQRNLMQPDLTNPDVIRIVTDRVRQWMKESPDARVFSVTQNDNNAWCQCPNCRAVVEREGGESGLMLGFVNKIAAALAKEFPRNQLLTFAYVKTLTPPKHLHPHRNVYVQVCAMVDDPQDMIRAVRGWRKLTDKIYVWDYVIGFTHYHIPFPNLYSLQPNMKLWAREGVEGVFDQGNWEDASSELSPLRIYLLAKLLWNPDINVDREIDAFLAGYYGDAAPYLRAYINAVHAPVRAYNYPDSDAAGAQIAKANPGEPRPEFMKGWWAYAWPAAYITPQKVKGYDALFEKAERSVAGDPTLLRRVQIARMSIWGVQIEMLPKDSPERKNAVERFFDAARKYGFRQYGEFKTMEQYRAEVMPN